ncbi:MAG: potassium/proton antiporter [Bacteroidales bacterium]|jgi:cell volume regulation protein A|nr:potassium/proton antiporter [Bacteroidales bacterium]
MSLTLENILLIGAVLLLATVFVSKISFRFGIPGLVLFLFIGMLAGSEGIGGLKFDSPAIAQFIGIVALNFILFAGGLETSWKAVKPVFWQGVSLSTLGVIITAGSVGVFVWLIADYFVDGFSLYEGLLVGAIISSTDAAAVFSILRSKKLALKYNLRPLLELESGSNDPMAYVLTIVMLELVVHPAQSLWLILPTFLIEIALGGLLGWLMGIFGKWVINRIQLEMDGLYVVLVIALMFFTFSITHLVHGNGFLAVYLSAVYLGNHDLMHKRSLLKMFDGFSWLMQIMAFLILGLLVYPSQLLPVAGLGLLIVCFLTLVARPISVLISLLPFKMKWRSKVYMSWSGLRGAVPIIFATYPLMAGIEKANIIFNIIFFVSLTSVLIQGTTLDHVARWLHVAAPKKLKPRSPVEQFLDECAKTQMEEIDIPTQSYAVGKKIVDLHFPPNAIIAMINRQQKFLTPNGSTEIKPHDTLVVLTDNKKTIEKVYEKLHLTLPEE